MARRDTEPVRITSATQSHSAEIRHREKRYMLTMGIRTACFVGAVVAYVSGLPHWITWALVAASLFLPYVAVVMANAGAPIDAGGPDPFSSSSDAKALEQGPATFRSGHDDD